MADASVSDGGTSDGLMEGLPAELREALRLELDPGERLRWCGQPDPGRVFRSYLPLAVLLALFLCGMGTGAVVGCVRMFLELRGLASPSIEKSSWGALFMFGAIGLGFLGVGLHCARLPFVERQGARLTAYVVTTTRVMMLRLDAKGRTRTNVVEPTHPLHLSRREFDGGLGTIYLYPRTQGASNGSVQSSSLTLVGVKEPREVERVIRMMFDPAR